MKALRPLVLILMLTGCSTQGFIRSGWHVGSITLCYTHSDTNVASAVSESACISIEPDSPSDDRPGKGLLPAQADQGNGGRTLEKSSQADRSLECPAN